MSRKWFNTPENIPITNNIVVLVRLLPQVAPEFLEIPAIFLTMEIASLVLRVHKVLLDLKAQWVHPERMAHKVRLEQMECKGLKVSKEFRGLSVHKVLKVQPVKMRLFLPFFFIVRLASLRLEPRINFNKFLLSNQLSVPD
jgi:hypothetical protein